jgi:ADP-heptose:LPS heptosyltransferase
VEPEVCIDEIYTDLSVLPKFKPDLWIEFRGTFYSLFRALISGCKVVLTRGYVRYLQRGNQLHERITNVRILSPILSGFWADFSANEQFNLRLTPFALTQTSPEIKKTTQIRLMELFAGKLQGDQLPRFALIHPGGRSLLRRWKPENFMEIERYLFEKYGIHSVVLGSQEEFDLVQQIAVQPFANPWISNDSLHVLLEMIQRAVLFIGNESGPLQIADLTETPAVGLFGPGVPNVFYPFNPRSKVLHYILDCNPCDQITCVRPQDRCVDRISVMEVKNSIDSILEGRFF